MQIAAPPAPRTDWLDRFETGFTLATLYFTTGTLNGPLAGLLKVEVDTRNLNLVDMAESATDAPIFLLLQIGILLMTIAWMALRPQRYLAVLSRPWLIWAYTGLVLVSAAWTPEPFATLRRAMFFGATTVFGIYFAARFSVRQQILLVASALAMSVFTNFTFGLLFPAYAQHVMYWAGAWRGIFTHKNAMAQVMVQSALILQIALPLADARRRRWLQAALACAVLLVLLSTSKTGLMLLLLLSLLLQVLRSLRVNRLEARLGILTVGLLIVLVVVGFVTNFELILTSLGRDPTLTGRTDIWAVLLEKAGQRFWLGYGFQAFWSPGMDGEAADLWYRNRYIVDTAHNGFIDILLQFGVVGLGIFFASLAVNVWRSYRWLMTWRSPEGLYPLAFFAYWVLYSFDGKHRTRGVCAELGDVCDDRDLATGLPLAKAHRDRAKSGRRLTGNCP
jgi:exopolysaccharide production protein ExoQ